jgi:phospholipid-binding lipoprotein MlaA
LQQGEQIQTVLSSEQKEINKDPYENINRKVFKFNAFIDENFLKVFAKAYKTVTPEIVDTSVTNFFLNLEEITNTLNSLLQSKPQDAVEGTGRFLVNTTFGLAGLLDVATEMGIERHDEDFGQTLAHWGVPSGPYVMLPILGPSTLRDAAAEVSIDRVTNPTSYSEKSIYFFAGKSVDKRADLLSAEEAFEDISDDPYNAVRDVWLQRRDYLIRDGKVDEKADTDLIDELEALDGL